VFSDSLRFDGTNWEDMFRDNDCEKVVMNHHYEQMRYFEYEDTDQFCWRYKTVAWIADTTKYEVWYGQWSLATDTCAQWIEGFNDGFTPPPHYGCDVAACPQTYLPEPFNSDFDRDAGILGPYGGGWTSVTNIHSGQCVVDSSVFNSTQMQTLGDCALEAMHEHLNGTFFMNFKVEQDQPKWDYGKARANGWLGGSSSTKDEEVLQFISI